MAQGYDNAGKLWGTVLGHPMAADGPHWALRANGGIRPPKLVHFETGPDGKMRLRLGEALATIFPVGE
jgi:hypothetical protein